MNTSISIALVGVLFYVRGIVDRILIGNVDMILNRKLTTFALPSVSYVRGILITYIMINEDFMLL